MNLNCGKFSSFQPFRQEGNYSKYVVCDRMDVCVCVYAFIPLGVDLTVYDDGRRTENEKRRQDQLNVEI